MDRPCRPSPETIAAWQNRRFGLFIHWGLYSIPGGVWKGEQVSGYNEQIRAHARIPKEEYAALATQFNPILWDPEAVAALAKAAGMKFVVITSKHHDGFALFDTAKSDFNVVDATPYGKDIVAGLADACARAGLGFGVYFSTIDWHFEGGTGIDYEDGPGVRNDNEIPDAHTQFNAAQLTELLSNYGPISEVWFDMGKPTLEQSVLFADTVHRLQPETMVSGRVFNYQGDFTVMGDNEIPPYRIEEPWQSPASIYHETWGYRSWQPRTDLAGKIAEHIGNLVRVVSRGGNYLLNIGPRGDGSIVEFEADVLHGIGDWLAINRAAIEGTDPQPFRYLDFGSATVCANRLYLFILNKPSNGELALPGLLTKIVSARLLGDDQAVLTITEPAGVPTIIFKNELPSTAIPVLEVNLAGPPVVRQPAIQPDANGNFLLTVEAADKFYHYNGYGYSDPPKLYKLRWIIEAANSEVHNWSIATEGVSSSAFQIAVDGKLQISPFDVPCGVPTTIELTGKSGSTRGAALPSGFIRIESSLSGDNRSAVQ